jgi:hypothetical protein
MKAEPAVLESAPECRDELAVKDATAHLDGSHASSHRKALEEYLAEPFLLSIRTEFSGALFKLGQT